MLFEAYLDDSGSHDDSPWFVLAGFLGVSAQWNNFNLEWSNYLQKYPEIDYFKMSEAKAMKGQFSSLNPRLRDQRVFELAEIVERHTIARICSAMSRTDFDTCIKGGFALE